MNNDYNNINDNSDNLTIITIAVRIVPHNVVVAVVEMTNRLIL